jgi:hypothetical protein
MGRLRLQQRKSAVAIMTHLKRSQEPGGGNEAPLCERGPKSGRLEWADGQMGRGTPDTYAKIENEHSVESQV